MRMAAMSARKSYSHKSIIHQVRQTVPPLLPTLHKGQCGRVGVVGGCLEYIGAPYYSSVSALYTGADLAFVFCAKTAGTALKTMSPEMIVYPILKDTKDIKEMPNYNGSPEQLNQIRESIVQEVVGHLSRTGVLIVGPGLGRDEFTLATTKDVIQHAKQRKLPIIIDGDGLYLVTQDPDVVKGYKDAILTPNFAEYSRLCARMLQIDIKDITDHAATVKQLANELGQVTIVRKGDVDIITDGTELVECSVKGGARRCGGQGDILAGTIGTFVAWLHSNVVDYSKIEPDGEIDHILPKHILAAYGGCTLTRAASARAFSKHYRATTAPAIIEEIAVSFRQIFERPETFSL